MSERKTIGSSVNIIAVRDGKDAAVMAFSPSVQFYDADNGGNAISYAQYPISFSVMVGNTTVSPNGNPEISFEGSDTSGIASIAAGVSGFTISIAQNSHPSCRIKVKTSVTKSGLNYEVIGYVSVAAIKMGAQGGSVSALSKMYYYDGVYASNKTYSLTSTQAPYVMYGTEFYVLDNAANGGAGTSARNVTPVDNGNPWTKMNSEMKYYIAEAMFANFAKLGSAIFNQDFMLSQYGSLMGYGGFGIPVTSTDYYQRADASNMLGIIPSYIHEGKYTTTVSNTLYNEELSRFSVSLDASKRYMFVIQAEASSDSGVEVMLTTAVDHWDQVFVKSITDNNPIVVDFSVWEADTYKLYYKRTGNSSTNPKITYSMVSLDTFRPNVFIDYKTGFLYSNKGQFDEGVFNKGFFGDVTVEGRINNLITEIDWAKGVGREKIITVYVNGSGEYDEDNPYTYSGSYPFKQYYLDVLSCGDFIYIKSLPDYSIGTLYRLPYYAYSYLQQRGHTIDTDGTKHPMTPDDLRRLVGRRITFRIAETNGLSNTNLSGMLSLTAYGANTDTKIGHIANARQYFAQPTNSDKADVQMYPQLIHMEFRQTVWGNYTGYGYVWTGQTGVGGNNVDDTLDEDWT